MKTTILLYALLLLSTLTVACAPKMKFSEAENASATSTAAATNSDDGVDGAINQPGSTTPAPTPEPTPEPPSSTPQVMPKVRFVGPPCIRGTNCTVQFVLDAPVAMTFEFDWKTNDTLYQTPAPAGQPIYGQPGVHYVSTSGHAKFLPGETVKTVYVQNINPYNIEIIIGIRMSSCTVGGVLDNCTNYFH